MTDQLNVPSNFKFLAEKFPVLETYATENSLLFELPIASAFKILIIFYLNYYSDYF